MRGRIPQHVSHKNSNIPSEQPFVCFTEGHKFKYQNDYSNDKINKNLYIFLHNISTIWKENEPFSKNTILVNNFLKQKTSRNEFPNKSAPQSEHLNQRETSRDARLKFIVCKENRSVCLHF